MAICQESRLVLPTICPPSLSNTNPSLDTPTSCKPLCKTLISCSLRRVLVHWQRVLRAVGWVAEEKKHVGGGMLVTQLSLKSEIVFLFGLRLVLAFTGSEWRRQGSRKEEEKARGRWDACGAGAEEWQSYAAVLSLVPLLLVSASLVLHLNHT